MLLAMSTAGVLALSDVPLVRVTSRPLPATGAQSDFVQAHWALVVVILTFVAGVGLVIFPRHDAA